MSLNLIMNTASTGLMAAQTQLRVVSDNVSNVNTPGYTRQRVELTARLGGPSGDGYIGAPLVTITTSGGSKDP